MNILLLDEELGRRHQSALARVLKECVDAGASVSFLEGLSMEEAEQFFEAVLSDVASGRRLLLAAFDGDLLIGTVQVVLAMPPNQPHRAEIAKLLVLPSARGNGVGATLMRTAEDHAKLAGKTLLVLDTCKGDKAEELYGRLGWVQAGVIPNYAFFPDSVTPCDTVIFWKSLV